MFTSFNQLCTRKLQSRQLELQWRPSRWVQEFCFAELLFVVLKLGIYFMRKRPPLQHSARCLPTHSLQGDDRQHDNLRAVHQLVKELPRREGQQVMVRRHHCRRRCRHCCLPPLHASITVSAFA